jgi:hypothetical protein
MFEKLGMQLLFGLTEAAAAAEAGVPHSSHAKGVGVTHAAAACVHLQLRPSLGACAGAAGEAVPAVAANLPSCLPWLECKQTALQ